MRKTRDVNRRSTLLFGALALSNIVGANVCSAADRSWGNSGGGTFSTSTNWINGLLAGINDVAIFNRSRGDSQTTYTVSFSAPAQNQAIRVANDVVTFNLAGRTYTTTATTGNAIGVSSSSALQSRLTIQNGTFNFNGPFTDQLLIGATPGGTGSLLVTGGGVVTVRQTCSSARLPPLGFSRSRSAVGRSQPACSISAAVPPAAEAPPLPGRFLNSPPAR